MHLRLLSALLAVLLSSGLSAQSKKDIKTYKIKATAVNVTLYDGGKQTSTYKESYASYDKNGETLEQTDYYSDGTVKRKETNTYDNTKDHNKTSEIVQKFDDPKKKAAKDDDDNSDDSKYKKVTYKYNGSGNKTEEAYYDDNGKLLRKTTFTYTSRGEKQFETDYDEHGLMTRKITYSYDGKGLKTEKKISDAKDVVTKVIKYTYTF
jgi:hypothetical protein